jgi:hypothetical protein
MDAKNRPRLCLSNHLDHPRDIPRRLRLSQPSKAESSDLERVSRWLSSRLDSLASLLLGEPDTTDFRQGKNAGRDHVIPHGGRVSHDILNCDLPLR